MEEKIYTTKRMEWQDCLEHFCHSACSCCNRGRGVTVRSEHRTGCDSSGGGHRNLRRRLDSASGIKSHQAAGSTGADFIWRL